MSDEAPRRTVTASGNVIYQRTQRGWVESVGLWPLALAVSILLLMTTLPPEPPYFDTASIGLLALVCGRRAIRAGRQMLVAIGDGHLQYIGMGRAWYFYYKDLARVDLADQVTRLSAPLPPRTRRPQAGVPRYVVFTMLRGNHVNIRLSCFEATVLLKDLEARLPKLL